MNEQLKALFDRCVWIKKYYEALPGNLSEIRYGWREDEAEFARLFLETGVMPETTAAVERSLYLGKDPKGAWLLCVLEKTQRNYDVEKMAQGICTLFGSAAGAFNLPEHVKIPSGE